MPRIRIAPSLAAVSQLDLRNTILDLVDSGADYVHFDIEDGNFVPMMTLGTKIISDLRPLSDLPFDVHLMVREPEYLIPELLREGADRISVHFEACPYPRRVLRLIVEGGASAGLAFNPATAIPDLTYLEPYLSFLVVLTTEPEGPDCPYLPAVLEKVRKGKMDPFLGSLEWVVDGGVGPKNIREVVEAGTDTVVVGRSAFIDGKVKTNLDHLRELSSG